MGDVTIVITATVAAPQLRSLPFAPIEIHARRAREAVASRRQGALGAPRTVRRRLIPVITGRRTDEQGRFTLTDADRREFQPGDEVFLRCELRDTAVTLKRYHSPHRPYVLWLRIANPCEPAFDEHLLMLTRDADRPVYAVYVRGATDTHLSDVPNPAIAQIAANIYRVLVRMNRWFEGLGTGARPLGHLDVHYPAHDGDSFYDGRRIVIGHHDGTSDAVICHEYGHRIFDKSQPAGYVEPGGEHVWFGRSGGRSVEEQRELDFSEAYATVIGLSFLETPRFVEETGDGVDVERAAGLRQLNGHHGVFGDAPTAAYLWDLVDWEGRPAPGHRDRRGRVRPRRVQPGLRGDPSALHRLGRDAQRAHAAHGGGVPSLPEGGGLPRERGRARLHLAPQLPGRRDPGEIRARAAARRAALSGPRPGVSSARPGPMTRP